MIMGYGNRGMSFEMVLNIVNNQYKSCGIALINKRPTPVKVLKSKGTQVLNGYFEEKSTVDYDGVYKGRAIAFEAKTTKEKRFPLSMVAPHQVDYLERTHKNGAISFLLVEIRPLQKVFFIPFEMLNSYLKRARQGGRKSIPLDELEVYGYEVERGRSVLYDYLAIVDKLDKERVLSGCS